MNEMNCVFELWKRVCSLDNDIRAHEFKYPDIGEYDVFTFERQMFEAMRECARILGKRQRRWKHKKSEMR